MLSNIGNERFMNSELPNFRFDGIHEKSHLLFDPNFSSQPFNFGASLEEMEFNLKKKSEHIEECIHLDTNSSATTKQSKGTFDSFLKFSLLFNKKSRSEILPWQIDSNSELQLNQKKVPTYSCGKNEEGNYDIEPTKSFGIQEDLDKNLDLIDWSNLGFLALCISNCIFFYLEDDLLTNKYKITKVYEQASSNNLAGIASKEEASNSQITSICFNSDGDRLIIALSNGQLKIMDVLSGKISIDFKSFQSQHQSKIKALAVLNNSSYLASALINTSNITKLINIDFRAKNCEDLTNKAKEESKLRLNKISWSMDDKTLAAGSADSNIYLINRISSKIERTLKGHKNQLKSLSWSKAKPTLLMSASKSEKRIKNWDTIESTNIKNFKSDSVVSYCAFISSTNNSFLTVQRDLSNGSQNKIYHWSYGDGKLIQSFIGHNDELLSLKISKCGKSFATLSKDKSIKIWSISPKIKEQKTSFLELELR